MKYIINEKENGAIINEVAFKNVIRYMKTETYDFPDEIPFPEVEKTENEKANDRLINEVLSKLKWNR